MSDDLKRLVPAAEALEIVLANVSPIEAEKIALANANGRVLASDLKACRTQPPFDASAMDGYAVRQTDISALPCDLNIIGQSRAGEPFDGPVGTNEAVRIFTGAVVPEGTDSIIIQENTRVDGNTVTVLEGSPAGKFIRKAGLDFTEGQTLLRTGETMTSHRLALAASMDHPTLCVHGRAKVALISTGDELVLPVNCWT